jgi:5-methylthioribose kinase
MDNGLDIENHEALTCYLQQQGWIEAQEQPAMQTLAGGVSNRAVLLQRRSGEAWVLKQALTKLRVASDWFSSPERIHREAQGLRWLPALAPIGTITPLIFEDHEQHVLAMQAVHQPHSNWKTLLLKGEVVQDHIEQFGRLIGTIHRHASEQHNEITAVFGDTTFFESLRVEPYYTFTTTQVPAATNFIHALVEETRAQRLTLVHGDYSPKNVLIYEGRLILLDHEVIHFGDPAFDLGFSLTHLLSKAHHLPQQRQMFATAAQTYWDTYRQTVNGVSWVDHLEGRVARHTLACLLARVAGRSPLEYLTDEERTRQQRVVLSMMEQEPKSVSELIDDFQERINDDDKD